MRGGSLYLFLAAVSAPVVLLAMATLVVLLRGQSRLDRLERRVEELERRPDPGRPAPRP